MKKILLVIKREYLTRVKKRSFVIMTILGPILMASVFILPVVLAQLSDGGVKNIVVLDETGIFYGKFRDSEQLKFKYTVESLEDAKQDLTEQEDYALLYIPRTEVSIPSSAILYSDRQPGIDIKSYIRNVMKKEVEAIKLSASGIDQEVLRSIKSSINLETIKITEDGQEQRSYTEVSMILGIFAGILIYMFIFIFGAQVMRGVIEEKTSRIVEVIISSVKPFQLMMGKIMGIAMVGLTQFLLWVVLTFIIVTGFQVVFADKLPREDIPEMITEQSQLLPQEEATDEEVVPPEEDQEDVSRVLAMIGSINFRVMVFSFLFFFLAGYLLYAALFAAVGSAVDSEADTQQFMLPITIPLILSIVMAQFVIQNPDGPVSFWFSIIPFTSPVVMMARIPFGVPYLDLYLSVGLLIVGFLGTTWLAARIYRTGILMYGKKVNYKELWRWLTYRG